MHRDKAKSHIAKLLVPIISISFVAIVVIFGLLLWSGKEVDRISRERDKSIVSLVISQGIERVAHAQESSTVWELAVRKVQERPLDYKWLDLNLGTWFKSYAGHDEVYVLSRDGAPLYAMRDGQRVDAASYRDVSKVVAPLVRQLRRLSAPSPQESGGVAMLSPGASDLAMLRGRPAIVSAKPIISDSGETVQPPGSEAVHVSVVYLDGKFLAQMSRQYGLSGTHFSMTGPSWNETGLPLHSHDGRLIGYFVWQPFAPGDAVTLNVAPVLLTALAFAGLVVFLLARRLGRNTMDLEASQAQAQHLALHDVLTGLPNRAMFENRLEAALARCRRDGSRLALLYLDLDRFKQVNDSLGHAAGDEVIREVARRLTSEIRAYDTVARLGGDEFAIILVEPGSRAATEDVCARIIADISRPFEFMGVQSFIGVSIGVALAPNDGTERNELARKADIALYKAKVEGRGRSAFFCPTMDEAVRSRDGLLRELRAAIADSDNQMRLYYQPVFSSRTGAMVAVEALLRWQHPDRGLVAPTTFIGLAEETGLIEDIGQWVLRTAIRDARRWPGLRMSINVSPVQLRNASFAEGVLQLIGDAAMKPGRLELEITETALMDSSAEVSETLARLRRCGIITTLDDFGTGYSSLSHIRDIAVDRIKIDRSFVTAIETGNGASLIQAIVTLAHANGLELTAEGVETSRQRDLLEDVGCEELQGYLFSRPVTADEITDLQNFGEKVCYISE